MTKNEDWNEEQLLVNICKFWKWALMLSWPTRSDPPALLQLIIPLEKAHGLKRTGRSTQR